MDNKSVLYQLMDTRMGEALHKITKEDTAFMQTKEKADKYAAKLASLNLPEETMRLIDQYVNERSANWVRYGELADRLRPTRNRTLYPAHKYGLPPLPEFFL